MSYGEIRAIDRSCGSYGPGERKDGRMPHAGDLEATVGDQRQRRNTPSEGDWKGIVADLDMNRLRAWPTNLGFWPATTDPKMLSVIAA